MPPFICQVDVDHDKFQNPQDFVTAWGQIHEEIERLGGNVIGTYAVLGDYDFLVTFEIDDADAAFQVSQVIERNGLDTTTTRAIPLDRIGDLVDDV